MSLSARNDTHSENRENATKITEITYPIGSEMPIEEILKNACGASMLLILSSNGVPRSSKTLRKTSEAGRRSEKRGSQGMFGKEEGSSWKGMGATFENQWTLTRTIELLSSTNELEWTLR